MTEVYCVSSSKGKELKNSSRVNSCWHFNKQICQHSKCCPGWQSSNLETKQVWQCWWGAKVDGQTMLPWRDQSPCGAQELNQRGRVSRWVLEIQFLLWQWLLDEKYLNPLYSPSASYIVCLWQVFTEWINDIKPPHGHHLGQWLITINWEFMKKRSTASPWRVLPQQVSGKEWGGDPWAVYSCKLKESFTKYELGFY